MPAAIRFSCFPMYTFDSLQHAQHRYVNQLRESGAAFQHLQSLRDIFTLHLTPAAGQAHAGSSAGSRSAAPRFMCPLTELPCTSYPFAALPACGHAFSSRAIAQVLVLLALLQYPCRRSKHAGMQGSNMEKELLSKPSAYSISCVIGMWRCHLVLQLPAPSRAEASTEKALNRGVIWVLQMADGQCATCGMGFAAEDIVALNGSAEQVQALRQRLELRRAKKQKGGKKRKLQGPEAGDSREDPPAITDNS